MNELTIRETIGAARAHSGASPAGSVSGTIRNKFPFPFGGQSFDPSISPDGTVYVGHQLGPTGTLYALDGPTLAPKWIFQLDISGPLDVPGVFISALAIRSDGTIFLAASAGSHGRVYSLDQSNGHINWEFDPGGPASGSPTIGADNTLYVPAVGKLFALNSGTGQQSKPAFSAGRRVSSPAPDTNGVLYFGADKVYALDSAAWQVLWSFAVQSPDPGCPNGQSVQTSFFGAPVIDERLRSLYLWPISLARHRPHRLRNLLDPPSAGYMG